MATVQTKLGPVDDSRQMTLEKFWDAEQLAAYRYELGREVRAVT